MFLHTIGNEYSEVLVLNQLGPPVFRTTTDLVDAGGNGLAAAYSAAKLGARILVIEKQP